MHQVTFISTFTGWQNAARQALAGDRAPGTIAWEEIGDDQPSLGLFEENEPLPSERRFRVPKDFIELAQRVACHRSDRRWPLLYSVLWRLNHGEPKLLSVVVDPEMHELNQMDRAVRHDVHKMRAFVRFREVTYEGGQWYVAWFEPEHHIVERNSKFFVDRFAAMHWSILTPDRCAHWDTKQLSFTAGVPRSEAPTDDAMEELWRTYYGNIFNPARVKTKMMQSEMPKRYWKNLPEAAIIPALLQEAPARVSHMMAASPAKGKEPEEDSIAEPPDTEDWEVLRSAALACRSCPLWKDATQTVFGEGPHPAPLMLLGEQPGDAEDLAGHPFVGPAGMLLNRAMEEAGIDRASAYVTNVVKHFKWEPRGKRRLHKTPTARDVTVCRPWFEAEIQIVRPKVLLCLGATAAKAVFGPDARIQRDRGKSQATSFAPHTLMTFHPSALLRAPDDATRQANYALFLKDLNTAKRLIEEKS